MRIQSAVPTVLLALATTLVCSPTTAAAQNVGVKGGIDVSNVSFNVKGDSTKPTSRTGVVGGFFLVHPIQPSISIQAEALIVVKGFQVDPVKTRVTYLEVPFLVRVNLSHSTGPTSYVFAGPALAFKLNAAENTTTTTGTTSTDIGADTNGFDLGLVGGVGIDFPGGFVLDARYTVGLSNTKASVASANGSVKNRSFALMAGIMFGK
jgi:hypothetical protein